MIIQSFHCLHSEMGSQINHDLVIRYRGFLLLEQPNKSWLVRPQRSPMKLLPFRASNCSLSEVKQILDLRLVEEQILTQAA